MVVYGVITVILTTITSKLPKMRKFINGTPTIIMNKDISIYPIFKQRFLNITADLPFYQSVQNAQSIPKI